MKFVLSSEFERLVEYIPAFVELCGAKTFNARARQLRRDLLVSPYIAKIVIDYHWMELCISDLSDTAKALPKDCLDDWCAAKFAAMCVEVHMRLTDNGKKELTGRLRDGLKSDSGFAPLYAEMDVASRFLTLEFDVGFEDLDRRAPFDLLVSKEGEQCEIECKSFSVDAGRKIHRRDFYRLADSVLPSIVENPTDGFEAFVLTMKRRLPSAESFRNKIGADIQSLLFSKDALPVSNELFHLARQDLMGFSIPDDKGSMLKEKFGPDIHVAGTWTETSGRLLIVRSEKEDDTSKPILQNIRDAAEQLSKSRPAFVALQFNDTEVSVIPPPNLVQRVAILSNAVFHHYNTQHLAGVMVGSYRNAVEGSNDISAPMGLMVVNPSCVQSLGPSVRSIFEMENIWCHEVTE